MSPATEHSSGASCAYLAAEYLREILEGSDPPGELLLGLRRIAEAQVMSKVAEAAGNPRLSTLVAALRVAGLRLSLRPAV